MTSFEFVDARAHAQTDEDLRRIRNARQAYLRRKRYAADPDYRARRLTKTPEALERNARARREKRRARCS